MKTGDFKITGPALREQFKVRAWKPDSHLPKSRPSTQHPLLSRFKKIES